MTTSPVLYPDTARPEPIQTGIRIGLLGSLEVDGRPGPTARLVKKTLALLAVRANAMVSPDDFIDELWGEKPPKFAKQNIQTYAYNLRQACPTLDVRCSGGRYMLAVDSTLEVDVHRFDHLVAQTRRLMAAGSMLAAEDTLRAGFSLWRGGALQDVLAGSVLSDYSAGLELRRRTALGLRFDIELGLGRHREIVDELEQLFRQDRAREDVAAQLMLALYRSRRGAHAVEVYAQLRSALIDEHGMDPCLELRALQQQILRGDPALDLGGQS